MSCVLCDGKTAPVQGYGARIPWIVHLRAYEAYAKEWGRSQSAERLAERGGFGTGEMDKFAPGWREEAAGYTALAQSNRRLREGLEEVVAAFASWPARTAKQANALSHVRAAIKDNGHG